MLASPQLKFLFIFCLIANISFGQKKSTFKYRNECYALFTEAYTAIVSKNDTARYNELFREIDSLTLSENNYSFYVKYLSLKGAMFSRTGYLKEGLYYNLLAIEEGEKHLPKNSSRIAVAHGNLGFTYHKMGEIDSFITHTLISNDILLTNPVKHASELIQTNFNLEAYLVRDADMLFKINEQTDSLVHYLDDEEYDIKAAYHLRKSKRASLDNNVRQSKYHIGQAIQYFNQAKNPKLNFRKYFYSAIALHYYLLKDYEKAIENYNIYKGIITGNKLGHVSAYINNQLSECYLGLNETDSAKHYVYKAYEDIKGNEAEKRDYAVAYHAIEVLRLNYTLDKAYDVKIFKELDEIADALKIIPIHYLEYAKIKTKIEAKNTDFYKTVLLENISNTESKVFESYYIAELAKYYFDENMLNKADSLFDVAMHLNQVLPDKTNALLHNSNLLKTYVDYKYKILHKQKNTFSGKEKLNRYDELINSLLTYVYENWDSEDRDETLEQIQFYCNEAITYCNETSKIDENGIPFFEYALYFSDKSNSILLKYNQRRIFALKNSKFSSDKLAKLQYYKGQLDAYFYGKVEGMTQKNLLEIQSQYNALLMEAQTSDLAFVETDSFEEFYVHLNEIRRLYDNIYVFHSTDKHVYQLNIKQRTFEKLNASKQEIINHQQGMFNAMVNHKVNAYESHANALYKLFLKEHVADGSKEVLIINAQDLLPIPFEGLVKSINGKSFNQLDYVLSDYVFTYNQGLSADFDYEKDFNLSLPYIGIYSESGTNLNYAKSEIEGVNKMLKGEVYHIDGYQQPKVLDRLKLAQIIHIATHSEIDSTNGYSSQLVFGDSTASANMKYYEIMNMDINPNLLVLNACSTANGEYKIGEGKISMARAFNYAGAQNVLVNTWDVSDFSVKRIMESFFSYYKNKVEVAKALKLSKEEYLKQSDDLTGNPLYWAGTIFVSSSHVKSNNYIMILGLGILVLSICFIAYAYLKNKGKSSEG